MNASIAVIRAVAGEITNRIYLPILITAIVIAALLTGLVIWLTTMNAWWLLLAIPLVIAILIVGALLIIVRIIIAAVTPSQNKTQRKEVKAFTDKLLNLSEITQTPKFILLFRIAKDVLSSNKSHYVESVISDTASLRSDFTALRRSFE